MDKRKKRYCYRLIRLPLFHRNLVVLNLQRFDQFLWNLAIRDKGCKCILINVELQRSLDKSLWGHAQRLCEQSRLNDIITWGFQRRNLANDNVVKHHILLLKGFHINDSFCKETCEHFFLTLLENVLLSADACKLLCKSVSRGNHIVQCVVVHHFNYLFLLVPNLYLNHIILYFAKFVKSFFEKFILFINFSIFNFSVCCCYFRYKSVICLFDVTLFFIFYT